MARDTAELIAAVCTPPVVVVGLSMGALIVQPPRGRPSGRHPGRDRHGWRRGSHGWIRYYMQAEIDYRDSGGRLDGEMAVAHFAASLYPARVLGDPVLWPRIRDELSAWIETGVNEESLIGQWDACQTFDLTDKLPSCTVPLHVFSFAEDVQAPPQFGREVADLCPDLHVSPVRRDGPLLDLWARARAPERRDRGDRSAVLTTRDGQIDRRSIGNVHL